MNGRLRHICVSEKKGRAKNQLDVAELRIDHGIVGDVHAGNWHRQVSLLDIADIDTMRKLGVELKPGAFGENLGVEGIDLDTCGIGTQLRIGHSELQVTQIGKTCHHRCAIYYTAGDCIMPRAGLFAEVRKGGMIHAGDSVEVAQRIPREMIQASVITVSDRCSRGEAVDTSGPALQRLIQDSQGAHIALTKVVPDDETQLAELLTHLCDRGYDLIVTTGGTGFAPRDVTPEATRSAIEREAPGLAEEMRRRSVEVTPHAMLQRGVCGIRGRTLIVNLPGSEKGATENFQFIQSALAHAIKHLRDQPAHEELELKREQRVALKKRARKVGAQA
ncbi:hypothetical protein KQI52_09150 [bacterium]|nr:hypothetical protein [bacterium]